MNICFNYLPIKNKSTGHINYILNMKILGFAKVPDLLKADHNVSYQSVFLYLKAFY